MSRYGFITFIITFILLIAGCGTGDADQSATNVDNDNASRTESVNDNNADNADQEASNDAAQSNSSDNNDEQTHDDSNTNNDQADENQTSSHPSEALTVHYIDVGQADATLFQYADDSDTYTILFDTGDWKQNDVVNYLAGQNISGIDLIVTSHPHADHIGQLAEIVNTYDVGEVWMSGNTSSSKTFQNALQAIDNSGADYHEPRTGEAFSIGPMDITVLYPDTITGDLNGESVSLSMSYGDIDFLFTGDAEKKAERQMIQSDIALDADILQLGHHGSKTSSTPQFIQAVSPETAIYSAAADSQYGHTSPEVVTRIQDAGIDLYGTDVNGTIVVTTDGSSYDIATSQDGTISPNSTGSADTGSSGASNQTQSSGENKSESSEASASDTGNCVDINNASVETLQQIKHIGPSRAEALLDHRPFSDVGDLTNINGIGPSRIADIKQEGTACVK